MSKLRDTTPNRYHYVDCGLDNIWLEGGFSEVDSPYGSGVSISDLEGLHRCIAEYLLEKPCALTGAEFRFLRTELDLSQFSLGHLCGRTERTVREWETRNETVDEPANMLIRFIYKQRFHPSANFEQFSQQFQKLQALDKQCHELALKITADGWMAVEEKQAA
jgi:putative transcriptional regulator